MRGASEACGGRLELRERPFLTQLDVRADEPGRTAIGERLGIALPPTPNTWTIGEPSALWLGPDEWLIVGRPGVQDTLEPGIADALTSTVGAVVDVTDQRTVLELSGPRARDVLAGACAIDLHPRMFGPGDCVQTLLAQTGVILAQRLATPTFWIFVRRSFADHLALWLLDAMIEYRSSDTP
ncbi:MAG: sarcosine oxidase subunit gamma [Acidimicrobiales bacterium]|nr:sarcosine oxidase subunit gamma [Acidimicrobiales bacterium]